MHNIIGISSGGSIISKQRNHREQRLNFFADPLDILARDENTLFALLPTKRILPK